MHKNIPQKLYIVIISVVICLLTACGAGGELVNPPSPPQPSIKAKSQEVIIEWNEVTGAYFYNVYWSDLADIDIKTANNVRADDTSVTIDNLTNDETYYFVVTAVGEGNESELSAELIATPISPPQAPNNVMALPRDKMIQVSWDLVAQTDEYHVQIQSQNEEGNVETIDVITTDLTYQFGGLDNGRIYGVSIKAINTSGDSIASNLIESVPTSTHKIAIGSDHSCVIKSDRSLWCWGDNSRGQIGDDTTEQRVSPVRIGLDNDWANIALGVRFTCAVKINGKMFCWGDNESGQLNIISTAETIVPTEIEIDHKVSLLAVNSQAQTTCEISEENSLYCWGLNIFGQAGVGNDEFSIPPSLVGEVGEWKAIALGSLHSCGVKQNGSLWCWGANFFGQLGDGSYDSSFSPTLVDDEFLWESVAVNSTNSCALKKGGQLFCWGPNDLGYLGDGTQETQLEPVVVSELETWTAVALGTAFTCAIHTDSSLFCWGDNSEGQIGNPDLESSNIPLMVGEDKDWLHVSAGDSHVCGLKKNGDVYCWGDDESGQVGIGVGEYSNGEDYWITNPTMIVFP